MAGYILKIVIEDTHPPVWRRILIPEKITFEELHRVIQIIFGWTDEHLHDFQIPSENICIDDGAEPWADYHYAENETLVEQFLLEYNFDEFTDSGFGYMGKEADDRCHCTGVLPA